MEIAVYDTKPYDRNYLKSPLIEWKFHDYRLNSETAITALGSHAVVVFVNDVVDAKCLKILADNGIQLVALRCAGFNNVDIQAAKNLGVAVTHVPAYSPHSVAEHTVGLLLALNRKIHKAYNRVRELNFSLQGLIGFDLFGKTAGIVGGGKIGKMVAKILKGFGMKVLVFDIKQDLLFAKEEGIEYTDLSTVFKTSDVISLHLPLIPQTYHMINEKSLSEMKQGVYLINTSRGKIIETAALLKALKIGHLGGVALDVYEEEEGIFFEDLSEKILLDDELSRLLTFPNVLITAHQAFFTHEALSEISHITIANLLALKDGTPFLPNTLLT